MVCEQTTTNLSMVLLNATLERLRSNKNSALELMVDKSLAVAETKTVLLSPPCKVSTVLIVPT